MIVSEGQLSGTRSGTGQLRNRGVPLSRTVATLQRAAGVMRLSRCSVNCSPKLAVAYLRRANSRQPCAVSTMDR